MSTAQESGSAWALSSRTARLARRAAINAAYGGGTAGALGALGWSVLLAEAKLARRTIGKPRTTAPSAAGRYGRHAGQPLHLVVIGDSSAAGLGCETPEQTPGALLAGGVARELDRSVLLDVVAVTGARSADLDTQVARALVRPVDAAVIMIGGNDVTHRVPTSDAARHLARAVATLRAADVQVVVATCPDLGTVKPLLQPLRRVAAMWSRRLAQAQTVAAVEAGGVTVSLGNLLAPDFASQPQLWSPDRFHPSAAGYARLADVLLPPLLEVLGAEPVTVTVVDSVQDIEVAAVVAARDPGLEVETLEGSEGAAAVGPGRLARLRRRRPLAGRGAPDARTAAGSPVDD